MAEAAAVREAIARGRLDTLQLVLLDLGLGEGEAQPTVIARRSLAEAVAELAEQLEAGHSGAEGKGGQVDRLVGDLVKLGTGEVELGEAVITGRGFGEIERREVAVDFGEQRRHRLLDLPVERGRDRGAIG